MARPFSACIMIRPPFLRGPLHRPEDRAVVGVEDARVGREQLEVGHALGDQLVHLGQGVVVDVRHDHVEAVVDRRRCPRPWRATRPGPSRSDCAARLDGEVDDRRRPAERRGARARLERVLREGAAEGQLHVGVHVDGARDDVAPAASIVSSAVTPAPARLATDGRDRLAVDQDVRVGGSHRPLTTVPPLIRVRIIPPRSCVHARDRVVPDRRPVRTSGADGPGRSL